MNDMNENQDHLHDEIDLKELFKTLWSSKLTILLTTLISLMISLGAALYLPNVYKSEALLSVNNEGNDSLSSLRGLSGLAGIAGVSLPDAETDKSNKGIEVLKSRKLFKEFVNTNNVLVPLMAANGWDEKSNSLKIDSNLYDIGQAKWVRNAKPPRGVIPSLQEAHEEFLKLLSISKNRETGLITIGIKHFSLNIAKIWIEELIYLVNKTIKDEDVAKAERSITYLKEQINNTQLDELQAQFFELIQAQTETVMLAKATPEYLFSIIDPPVAPELKSEPNRLIIVFIGSFIGFILAIFFVLMRDFIKR